MTNSIPSEVPYLDTVLKWNETLSGLPSLPIVVLGCIVVGYMVKLIPVINNQWIPLIVFLFGVGANLGIQPPDNWVRSVILGLVAGTASIIIHKKILKNWIDVDVFPPNDTKPTPPAPPVLPLLLCLLPALLLGCKSPSLEPGGVYAPKDELGRVVYSDIGLALADASYKFAYETVLSPLKFEKDNRAQIMALDPQIGLKVKQALDKVRVEVWEVDVRWAKARNMYRANPTPVGLSNLQTILLELQRIIPVVQAQLVPVYQVLTIQ